MTFLMPFSLSSFVVRSSALVELEANGLPKLPTSVPCFSRLHSLRNLSHPNICRYLDVVRRKPERILFVTESYTSTLADKLGPVEDVSWLCHRFLECINGLKYLNKHGLVHAFISPQLIYLDRHGSVKISNYGLFYASGWGEDVNFPVADPVYSAPEVFILSPFCEHIKNDSIDSIEPAASDAYLPPCPLGIEADLWSIGLIFFELIHGRFVANPLHKNYFSAFPRQDDKRQGSMLKNPFATIRILLEGLIQSEKNRKTLPDFLQVDIPSTAISENAKEISDLCRSCLNFNPRLRPDIATICSRVNMLKGTDNACSLPPCVSAINMPKLDCDVKSDTPNETISSKEPNESNRTSDELKAIEFLSTRTDITEVYYYWRLAGGDLDAVLRDNLCTSETHTNLHNSSSTQKDGPIWFFPPILRVPHYLALERNTLTNSLCLTEHFSNRRMPEDYGFDLRSIPLPGDRLISRISTVPLSSLYPLLYPLTSGGSMLETTFSGSVPFRANEEWIKPLELPFRKPDQLPSDFALYPSAFSLGPLDPISFQPVSIKQGDVGYQIHRVCLLSRLLDGLPATEQRFRFEVRKDIPPFLRARVWAALFGVHRHHDFRQNYAKALTSTTLFSLDDKLQPVESDHMCGKLDDKSNNQINVDLPRCHAYDTLIASPIGRRALRRVLVSTLLMEPRRLEYTQGMDSIASVFVRLFYPDEALAAFCLRSLLTINLTGFFSAGGFTTGLKDFFNILIRLFAFHLPRLASLLIDLNVPLIGLTTGWIYTLFAHAMPLDRTEILWDTLLVGPPAFPMLVYLAVFHQLDRQVIFESMHLEDICTTLSNFPEIDLDRCRMDALEFALATPRSLVLTSMYDSVCSPTATAADRSPFYKRLCCSDAWPDHLSFPFPTTADSAHPIQPLPASPAPLITECSSLVPLLHPADALHHLDRPDCFVLDIRSTEDYMKGYIPGSVHRLPNQLPNSVVGTFFEDATLLHESHSSQSLINEWEFVDSPCGTRRRPVTIPSFLVGLMSEDSWIKASYAWRQASQQRHKQSIGFFHQPSLSDSKATPGIVIIVGGEMRCCLDDVAAPQSIPLAIQLADWLIHHELERVCVLNGGIGALLELPDGVGYLV